MKAALSIKNILIFVGSFVVINIALYFFLKATQPKSTVPVLTTHSEHQDSLGSTTDSVAYDSIEHISELVNAGKSEVKNEEPVVIPPKTAPSIEIPEPDMEPDLEEESPEDQATDLANTGVEDDPRKLKRLAKLLQTMKPQQAAPIITQLSEETIVALFMNMRERPAAKIMALLPVDQAAQVSYLMTQMVDHASR